MQEDQGAVREQVEGQPAEGLQDGAGTSQPDLPGKAHGTIPRDFLSLAFIIGTLLVQQSLRWVP